LKRRHRHDVQLEPDHSKGDFLLLEVRRDFLGADDTHDVFQGGLRLRPLVNPAHEVDRFAASRNDQHPLLDRPGEVEKIGVLDEECGVDAVPPEPLL